MYDAQSLLSSLGQRGIRLEADEGSLIARPASKLTDQDRELIRQHKAALLAYLRTGPLAHDAEATGHDLVDHLSEHASDLLDQTEDLSLTPAESIIGTCRRLGIALSLTPDGGLVVGQADGTGAEPDVMVVLRAIEAHLPAVTRLVADGWHLHANPKVPNAA
jgi:hypothetical protein